MPHSSNDISTSSFWSTIFADSNATFFFSAATWSTNDRSGVGARALSGASAALYIDTVAAVVPVPVVVVVVPEVGGAPVCARCVAKSCTCWSIAWSTGLIAGNATATATAVPGTARVVSGTGAAGRSSTASSGIGAGTDGTSRGSAAFLAANVAASGSTSATAPARATFCTGEVSANMSAMCVASEPDIAPRRAAGLAYVRA